MMVFCWILVLLGGVEGAVDSGSAPAGAPTVLPSASASGSDRILPAAQSSARSGSIFSAHTTPSVPHISGSNEPTPSHRPSTTTVGGSASVTPSLLKTSPSTTSVLTHTPTPTVGPSLLPTATPSARASALASASSTSGSEDWYLYRNEALGCRIDMEDDFWRVAAVPRKILAAEVAELGAYGTGRFCVAYAASKTTTTTTTTSSPTPRITGLPSSAATHARERRARGFRFDRRAEVDMSDMEELMEATGTSSSSARASDSASVTTPQVHSRPAVSTTGTPSGTHELSSHSSRESGHTSHPPPSATPTPSEIVYPHSRFSGRSSGSAHNASASASARTSISARESSGRVTATLTPTPTPTPTLTLTPTASATEVPHDDVRGDADAGGVPMFRCAFHGSLRFDLITIDPAVKVANVSFADEYHASKNCLIARDLRGGGGSGATSVPVRATTQTPSAAAFETSNTPSREVTPSIRSSIRSSRSASDVDVPSASPTLPHKSSGVPETTLKASATPSASPSSPNRGSSFPTGSARSSASVSASATPSGR
ncbi:hypothetical protein PYCC9005_002050 [Savitreella phatthalungensis]